MPAPRNAASGTEGDRRRMGDVAYEVIRDRIIRVELLPGAPLEEAAIVRELGLGLTPVREAFKRLALEKLAVIYPRRGTFIADIRVSDERWLTETRVELEGLAAALAAKRATEEEIQQLEDLVVPLRGLRDRQRLVETDIEIHRAVYAAAHNPYLRTTLDQYFNLSLRIWYHCMDRLPTIGEHAHNQAEMVAAIRRRAPVRARKAAEAHLRTFSDEVRAVL